MLAADLDCARPLHSRQRLRTPTPPLHRSYSASAQSGVLHVWQLQIVPGSHHVPINAKGDQLSDHERALHAPPEKRLHLTLQRGEVTHARTHARTHMLMVAQA